MDLLALASLLASGCSSTAEPELPEPPDGAELVLEIGDLEVYKAFDGELCAGTLRRIELHVDGLAELFDMDPPRARVFLYAEFEAVKEACGLSNESHGCAPWWGAHAMPDAVTHELVHVFVHAATGVYTRPAIQEGVALALEGDWDAPGRSPITLDELESELSKRSQHDLAYSGEAHFFAWAIDHFGMTAVMDAHSATAGAENDAEVELAIAQSFGFDSLSDLYVEYEATRALAYPPWPDTTKVFTAEELAAGTVLDTSCAGAYTEGPTEGELVTRARLEVLQPGEYAVEFAPLPLSSCPPRWRPTEPLSSWPELDDRRAEVCIFDQTPRHVVFHLAGQHEIAFDDTDPLACDVQPPEQVGLSARYLNGGDECTYP